MYQQTCHISQVFVHYMYLICLLVSGSKTSTWNVSWYVHMWNRLNIIVRYMSCTFEQSPRLLAQLAWFNSNYLRICLASWILHVKIFWRNCHHVNITCTKKNNNNVGSQKLYCKQKVHITVGNSPSYTREWESDFSTLFSFYKNLFWNLPKYQDHAKNILEAQRRTILFSLLLLS